MAIPTDPSQPFPLETVSESGKVPKRRLKSAADAYTIYDNVFQANVTRNSHGATIQGMFDGNPPYNSTKMRQQGQAWRANFNTLEGKARKDAAKTPYYDLFSSAQLYADAETLTAGDRLSATQASRIIATEFDRMLRDWEGFDYNIWQMIDDFVGFGRGYLFFLQPSPAWRPKRIAWHKVLFPNGASVDPEEWGLFVVEHTFDPTRLNDYLRDEKAASTQGWNVKAVRKAIRLAMPQDPSSSQDSMLLQQSIRDNDIETTIRASVIHAASIFVREFDGTWSRMIIQVARMDGKHSYQQSDEWLYYHAKIAEKSVNEIIAPFFLEVETGSVNGLGGIGRDMFSIVKAKDRMRCEQVNNVFMRSTILLQAQDAGSLKRASQLTVGGGVTIVPNGLTMQQSTMLGDIEGTLVVNQDLDRMLDANTGIYRPSFEKPAGNPETATAAQLRFTQATVLTNSAVNRFYRQLDRAYQEIYRRVTLDLPDSNDASIVAARDFQSRVREAGVTMKQLRNTRVNAMRTVGNGSPAMRQQALASTAAVMNDFGQRGRQNFIQDYVAAYNGYTKVQLYLPPEDTADLPSEQDREAMQENTSIKVGNPVLVIENDNHPVHLGRHFEAAFGALEAIQQGGPPAEAFAFVQGALPHIVDHIQSIRRKDVRSAFEKQFRQLEQAFTQMQSQVQQAQEQQAQQQRAMSEIELRQVETQAKIQERAMKTDASLDDKQRKSAQQMAIADAQTASQITQQAALTRSKLENDRLVAQAKASAASQKPKAGE